MQAVTALDSQKGVGQSRSERFRAETVQANMLSLPAKKDQQSLNGYVREHLRRLEHELSAGVPYQALANAVRAAGFEEVPVRSIRTAVYRARRERTERTADAAPAAGRSSANPSPLYLHPPLSSVRAETAAIVRRFVELVRVPGADETDPLI